MCLIRRVSKLELTPVINTNNRGREIEVEASLSLVSSCSVVSAASFR